MKKTLLIFRLTVIICSSVPAFAQNITTVAGNGQFSYGGDGAPALNSAVYRPTGICMDSVGGIFIADSYNNVIRRINPSGIMFTVAGNGFGAGAGAGGYTGDHGPAIAAELSRPQGLALDRAHNLYIADAGNHVVRKVDTAGIITTFAGTGTAGSTGDGGLATAATLNMPAGLAFDDTGNLYISDYQANMIRKINIATGIIYTIAGTGVLGFYGDGGAATAAQFGNPWFLYVDRRHNIFVCDNGNHRIRRIDSTGIITTCAGNGTPGHTGDGGAAISAELGVPVGICADTLGNLYFTDNLESTIRKITPTGTITAIAGTGGTAGYSGDHGPAAAALLNAPAGIVMDRTNKIFFCDNRTNVVRSINAGDTIITIAGNIDSFFCGDGGPASQAMLDSPMAAAFDDSGNVYVADYGNNCIRIIRPSGTINTFAGDALAGPGFAGDGGPATSAKLNHPKGVALDAAGNVYISDAGNACIRIVHTSGNIATFAGTPLSPGYGGDGASALSARINDPNGLLVDTSGNVYFSDAANHRVRVIHTSGNIATFTGDGTSGSAGDGAAATSAQLVYPMGLAMDAVGNIYVADTGAARVRIIHTSGNIATFAGTGISGFSGDGGLATAAQLVAPNGVVVDDTGNVHITDAANSRIRIVHTSGNIATYAGTGSPGFNGDGPLASAQLNRPVGLSKDQTGRLYVTDRNNNRVRRFNGMAGGLAVNSVNKTSGCDLIVFPNPNKGTFTINYSSAVQEPVHYVITNMIGQKIGEMDAVSGQSAQIQLSAPPGIYLLNATTGHSRTTAKIVIDP